MKTPLPARGLPCVLLLVGAVSALLDLPRASLQAQLAAEVRVGIAASEFVADDSMVIAGGIGPAKASGEEGKLRAVATVLEKSGAKIAIVACDVLMLTRRSLDPVVSDIGKTTGIPSANVLINCTHTHHAPSTMRVHDYDLDPVFTKRVQESILKSVQQANASLIDCRFQFALGHEDTVGQNSRQLLDDGMIYWVGPRTNFVRATGPFDPELPVLAFRDRGDKLRALFFNHSTHTIGSRQPGKRSPGFYGLAAQEIEAEQGGIVSFLEGASGSTHNLNLAGDECTRRIKAAVLDTLARVADHPISKLAAWVKPKLGLT